MGGFVQSCNMGDTELSNDSGSWYLSSVCRTESGQLSFSRIRLGLCVGNEGGQLVSQQKSVGSGLSLNPVILLTSHAVTVVDSGDHARRVAL